MTRRAPLWISSGGGPLICADMETARIWRGVRGSSIGIQDTDYARSGYLGVLPCGSSRVLVLGDEPLRSAFWTAGNDRFIARWVSALSDDVAINALMRIPSSLRAIEQPIAFAPGSSPLVMFDAAADNIDNQSLPSLDVLPGSFSVSTERYKEDHLFEFLIHRFIPSSAYH
jgi:hypothetical protein